MSCFMDANDITSIKDAIEKIKKFKTNAILSRINKLKAKGELKLEEIKELDALQDMLEEIYFRARSQDSNRE